VQILASGEMLEKAAAHLVHVNEFGCLFSVWQFGMMHSVLAAFGKYGQTQTEQVLMVEVAVHGT
jgi:hypothetical protein